MHYVITGGAGNISKPLTQTLLQAGHEVTVIGRNPEHLKPLTDAGAKAAIGSVEDVDFLTKTFSGADAVYTMVPPKWDAADWKGFIGQIGAHYAKAIQAAGVTKVVNLSSIGAHLPEGCGPVSGLYRVEAALNALNGVDVVHLRPGFFFSNMFANIPLIKQMGILGGNYGDANTKMVVVDTNDIAAVAATVLLDLNFTGKSVRYIASDERTTGDFAKVLGTAIGKPELPWVGFTDEQTLGGMLQAGLSQEVAANYVEMGIALRNGTMASDYEQNKPVLSKTKLEDFAQVFAAVYHSN